MTRPTTPHVAFARQQLLQRLRSGRHQPGERFLSNRAAAQTLGVSYQTADRLLRELTLEGLLDRRAGSGTFVPGRPSAYAGARLLVDVRARRPGSFGARLVRTMTQGLRRAGVDVRVQFCDANAPPPAVKEHHFPIVWELPCLAETLSLALRQALLINARPSAGMASLRIDSVSFDDYSGGACAAEMLMAASEAKRAVGGGPATRGMATTARAMASRETARDGSGPRRFAVLAGPRGDLRSESRAAGFLSVAPAKVLYCPNWHLEGGLARAGDAIRFGPDGVFCCNDRLAQAVLRHIAARTGPLGPASPAIPAVPVIGFDDAPVAARLNLTTMAIPWQEASDRVAEVALRRLRGDDSPAQHVILPTRPISRQTA